MSHSLCAAHPRSDTINASRPRCAHIPGQVEFLVGAAAARNGPEDTSLRNYMPKYIKPTSNRYRIICGCKTCKSAMLLSSDLNKWRISQLDKLDKLYVNYTPTRPSQTPKNYFIEYKNQIFPNNPLIHLRACDAASSYHCPSPITGSNIPKWDFILNCFSDCPRTNAPYLESPEQLHRFFPYYRHKIKFHILQKRIKMVDTHIKTI